MSRDEQAMALLRKLGRRFRVSIECLPQQDDSFQLDVYSKERDGWVTLASCSDPADAIIEGLSPEGESVIEAAE